MDRKANLPVQPDKPPKSLTTTIGPPQRQASRNTRLVTAEGQRSQDVVGSSKFQNCQKKVREKRTTKKKLMSIY
ncbi:hypothetical protein ARALYDRAFT_893066 [Arabidopsis lyrata subsp. lyrata]|uniref:Uncharacterized protein n=1 Tax=Arabidopsis lyrata subsp. lyrata TaxID=81972 RepID=D7KTE1_ARALL|nr:hypothetical protein ARALYDRAFT_893066 [Arabidopsis lyrata subsp. lyrata]